MTEEVKDDEAFKTALVAEWLKYLNEIPNVIIVPAIIYGIPPKGLYTVMQKFLPQMIGQYNFNVIWRDRSSGKLFITTKENFLDFIVTIEMAHDLSRFRF